MTMLRANSDVRYVVDYVYNVRLINDYVIFGNLALLYNSTGIINRVSKNNVQSRSELSALKTLIPFELRFLYEY